MENSIQPLEIAMYCLRESVKFRLGGRKEVQRHDGGLRKFHVFNFIIDRFKLCHTPTVKNYRCAVASEVECGDLAKALAGARYQYDPISQNVRGR